MRVLIQNSYHNTHVKLNVKNNQLSKHQYKRIEELCKIDGCSCGGYNKDIWKIYKNGLVEYVGGLNSELTRITCSFIPKLFLGNVFDWKH